MLSLIVLTYSCSTKTESKEESKPTKGIEVFIEKVWESDTLLTTSESVLYDKENNVLYVSCINGVPPTAKDEDGFIAKISPTDGSIIEEKWITGLDAPKGMGLLNGILYVTNIDELIAIDIASGEITEKYHVEGAEFLNDITIAADSNIYISDSNTSKIHVFKSGVTSLFVQAEGGPNGLYYDGDKLMMASFGTAKFNQIDLGSQEITPVVDSIPSGDGIVKVGGDYLVSNWNGEVYYVSSTFEKKKILDTKKMGANAADIEFINESNLLLVPTFFGNQVVAYKISK